MNEIYLSSTKNLSNYDIETAIDKLLQQYDNLRKILIIPPDFTRCFSKAVDITQIIYKKRLFIGSINSSVAHPREIFKYAYLLSASYIICIHNHPSGDPTPSREDIQITKNLNNIAKIHAIYLIDHIIIGNNQYYSFYQDNNVLNT